MPKQQQRPLKEHEWRYRDPQPRPEQNGLRLHQLLRLPENLKQSMMPVPSALYPTDGRAPPRPGAIPRIMSLQEPQEMTLDEFNRVQAEQHGVNMKRLPPRQPKRGTQQLLPKPKERDTILGVKKNVALINEFSLPEDVEGLQQMLKLAGFDPGEIDGKFGKRTRAAVKEFQKANGLKVDGKVGVRTLGKLNSAVPYMAPNYQAGQAWAAQLPGNPAWAEYEGEPAPLPRARPGPGLRG